MMLYMLVPKTYESIHPFTKNCDGSYLSYLIRHYYKLLNINCRLNKQTRMLSKILTNYAKFNPQQLIIYTSSQLPSSQMSINLSLIQVDSQVKENALISLVRCLCYFNTSLSNFNQSYSQFLSSSILKFWDVWQLLVRAFCFK